MIFSLSSVFEKPELLTYKLILGDQDEAVLRPLVVTDEDNLDAFLNALSDETRAFILPPETPLPKASKLCGEINNGDKLRLVVETEADSVSENKIIALLEFSFKIPAGDVERFKAYRYDLDDEKDCRFGPTIADDYQNTGLGVKLFTYVTDIVRKLGKERIILWDGVLKENQRAVHYFEKNGFRLVGTFYDEGDEMIDMILELK